MNFQSSTNSRPAYVTVAASFLVLASVIEITKLKMFAHLQVEFLAVDVFGFVLAWLIFHGRNWARWVCLVLTALAFLGLLLSPGEIRWRLTRSVIETARFCFESLLSPVAVTMLFLPASNEWFRQQKNAA